MLMKRHFEEENPLEHKTAVTSGGLEVTSCPLLWIEWSGRNPQNRVNVLLSFPASLYHSLIGCETSYDVSNNLS